MFIRYFVAYLDLNQHQRIRFQLLNLNNHYVGESISGCLLRMSAILKFMVRLIQNLLPIDPTRVCICQEGVLE